MKMSRFILSGLFVMAFQANAGEEGMARIITSASQAAKCISPVHILKIDGREINVQRMGFNLEPGKHTMSGRTLVDSSFCNVVGPGSNRDNPAPLEAEFEAGKWYWVGYDHSSPDRKDWKYVIWKVRDQ